MTASMQKRFGKKLQVSFEDFVLWYERKMGQSFDPKGVTLNADEPLNSQKATFIQKMAYQIEKVREPAIQDAIMKTINNFDKVMVVYGSGHYPKQKMALEDAFGKPKVRCLGQTN